jgi:hypothetical protein
MELAANPNPDPRVVLTKALLNAGRTLGLSQEALGDIIGRDRSSIARGLDPDSKAGVPRNDPRWSTRRRSVAHGRAPATSRDDRACR